MESYDTVERRTALGHVLSSLQYYRITPDCIQILADLVGEGGHSTVRRALWLRANEEREVAVKAYVTTGRDRLRNAVRLAREVRIIATLDRPNILPLLGFNIDLDREEAWLISPFLSKGAVSAYRNEHEVGFDQIIIWVQGITDALAYLHSLSPPVVHGDLKGNNVLLNASLDAVLCDLGSAHVIEGLKTGLTTEGGGTSRYRSPELLFEDGAPLSTASDVWAWACVVLEFATGKVPFATLKGDGQIFNKLLSGDPQPSDWPDFTLDWVIWPHLAQCFKRNAVERSSVFECLLAVNKFASSFREQSIYDLSTSSNISRRQSEQSAPDQFAPGRPPLYETEAAKAKLIEISASLSQYRIEPSCLKIADFPFVRGGYGSVFEASFTPRGIANPVPVAIKVLHHDQNKSSIRLATSFMREVVNWQRLKHENVLPFVGFHLNPEAPARLTTYIVSPRLRCGSISTYLGNLENEVNAGQRLDWVRGVTSGLVYLHCSKPSIIHGDLKADNILINDSLTPVLCDFGLAVSPEHEWHDNLQTANSEKCTLRWCSPEVLTESKPRSVSSDVWAWGCVVLEIMTNTLPFPKTKLDFHVFERLRSGEGPRPDEYPTFSLDESIWPFLVECFQTDPAHRPDSERCLLVAQEWRI